MSPARRPAAYIPGARHDALLIALRGMLGDTAALMGLLSLCPQQGVAVAFVPRPQAPCGARPYQPAAGESASAAS
jgi:hypothetical protein